VAPRSKAASVGGLFVFRLQPAQPLRWGCLGASFGKILHGVWPRLSHTVASDEKFRVGINRQAVK
jgi:hypothetical protein